MLIVVSRIAHADRLRAPEHTRSQGQPGLENM
jgi:hypothetical protein